ncbi:MAG: PIN domain-containing protein [Chloroflexi bacterium]|nr:PIN domain-containing protein [Chloroflexota bacterium]
MLGENARKIRQSRIAASLAATVLALAAHMHPAAATGPRPLDAGAIDIPYPGAPSWNLETYLLSSGNVIVADSEFDLPGADDAGAVFLYDGATGALISRLTGTSFDGSPESQVTLLSNANFVINSTQWRLDADVIVRLLTGDDLTKQRKAVELFERVERGELVLRTPVTTIAEVVYVLSSPRLYKVERSAVAEMLQTLIRLPGFEVDSQAEVMAALDLFAQTRLDFGDAFIAAGMLLAQEKTLYSYDRDFDKLDAVTRVEP